MVVRNKIYRIIDKYRNILAKEQAKSGNKQTLRGVKNKNIVIDFYIKYNRWPSRLSKSKLERRLGTRFENYVSKESGSYDSSFRRLSRVLGRNTNSKRKHDVRNNKNAILEFIENHGRVPTTYGGQVIEGEARLRSKLDYYTKVGNDMTLLGKVYKADKCHKSGVPAKYRPIINQTLDIEKPLIRMV